MVRATAIAPQPIADLPSGTGAQQRNTNRKVPRWPRADFALAGGKLRAGLTGQLPRWPHGPASALAAKLLKRCAACRSRCYGTSVLKSVAVSVIELRVYSAFTGRTGWSTRQESEGLPDDH
jgi:hypothetical protein